MSELINLKIKAAIAIISLVVSWIIAQLPTDTSSIIADGFDQLFSLGLLIVAVVVIWKAFSKKDESETALLKEQIQIQKDHIEQLQKIIERQE